MFIISEKKTGKVQYIEESNPDTATDPVCVTITQSSKQLGTSGVHVPPAPNSDNIKHIQQDTSTKSLPCKPVYQSVLHHVLITTVYSHQTQYRSIKHRTRLAYKWLVVTIVSHQFVVPMKCLPRIQVTRTKHVQAGAVLET